MVLGLPGLAVVETLRELRECSSFRIALYRCLGLKKRIPMQIRLMSNARKAKTSSEIRKNTKAWIILILCDSSVVLILFSQIDKDIH